MPLRLLVFLALIASAGSSFAQYRYDDSESRQKAAERIRLEGVQVDWNQHSLIDLLNMEGRIRTANRIKRDHGIHYDWKTTDNLEMLDAESRLRTSKRIKRDYGVDFDWKTSSSMDMFDAESRMRSSQRLSRETGQSVDWRQHSSSELLEMQLNQSRASRAQSQTRVQTTPTYKPDAPRTYELPKLPEWKSTWTPPKMPDYSTRSYRTYTTPSVPDYSTPRYSTPSTPSYDSYRSYQSYSTPSYSYSPGVAENGDIRGWDNDGDGRGEPVHVRGYTRKDGTYVRGHYRARPRR